MPTFSGGGSGGASGLLTRTTTVTNAQILNLVVASVELIPAPGAGKVIVGPSAGQGFVIVTLDTSAGAYTNVAQTVSLEFSLGGDISQNYGAPGYGYSLLTFAAAALLLCPTPDTPVTTFPDSLAALENQPEALLLANAGLGNVTGGNAANVMKVTVGYQVVTVP